MFADKIDTIYGAIGGQKGQGRSGLENCVQKALEWGNMLDSGTTKTKNAQMHWQPPGNAHQRSLHAEPQACCVCQGCIIKIGVVTWKDGVGAACLL